MLIPMLMAFVGGTLLGWAVLSALWHKRSLVERRLQAHAAPAVTSTPPEAVSSARHLAPGSPGKQGQKARPARLSFGRARRKRQHAFTLQIVDALTLISSSLKAGYSFIQSMDIVAREVTAPLGEEFALALHEMSLGATVEDSLEEMTWRVGVEDWRLVVTAVLVQRQTGGNLAEVLDSIAQTVRERIRIQGEIRTLTAQGRISGWVVGCLPVGLACVVGLINPSYMSVLFRHPVGLLMLSVGACGQVMGVLVIRKIVQIEV